MSKKIIYIIGAGRSGTTLLDIVLGNNPQTFSAGELNRFPTRNGIPPLLEKESPKFIFWDNFKTKLFQKFKKFDFAGLNDLINKYEYHLGVFRILFGSKSSKSRIDYHEYLQAFFDTLSNQIDQEIIIDSSKYPCRGYHLSQIYKDQISFVYIKRNPIGVVKSFEKKEIEQPPKGWLMANIYLFCVNMLCLFILKRISKSSKVVAITLESLTNEPEQTLTHISKELNVDLSHSISLAKAYAPLKTGCLFDGNRLRLKSEIVMEKVSVKNKNLTFKEKITWSLNSLWYNKNLKSNN